MSLMKISKAITTKNPVQGIVVGGGVNGLFASTTERKALADTLSIDVGLDIAKANDQILVTAMAGPQAFITARTQMMDNLAIRSAAFSNAIIVEITRAIPGFPVSVLNDIGRSIGAQALSSAIKAVDAQIGGVNDLVVKRITTN